MKLYRLLLAGLLAAGLVGVAYVGQAPEPPGARMTDAAGKFLETLKEDQRSKAAFAFDSKERTNWQFVPYQDADKKPLRKGLPLEEMSDEQRKAALDLVRAGTSETGYTKATTIMSLESILREEEKGKASAPVRNPNWYFFTVFGKPSKADQWGWRVEGHHLSLNFTIDNGQVASATPAFFGANPATVMDGDRKGLRTLPQVDDLARELFQALDQEQRAVALQKKQFGEPAAGKPAPEVGAPTGLPGAKMTDRQRDLLWKLIETYAERMPAEVGQAQLKEARHSGLDKVYFAYAGGAEPGEPHTYRVQGPAFVLEFLNNQTDGLGNPANHIHSVWRNLKGDFGLAAK
jgi:hypothetical protein